MPRVVAVAVRASGQGRLTRENTLGTDEPDREDKEGGEGDGATVGHNLSI